MEIEIPKVTGRGVIEGLGKPYRVTIRRDPEFGRVKPEAEQIDGKVFVFYMGWVINEDDSSLYSGEIAMIPNDCDWPLDSPTWIASGDLIEYKGE